MSWKAIWTKWVARPLVGKLPTQQPAGEDSQSPPEERLGQPLKVSPTESAIPRRASPPDDPAAQGSAESSSPRTMSPHLHSPPLETPGSAAISPLSDTPAKEPQPPQEPNPSPLWLLRRSDQAVVAGLVVLALLGMGLWWWAQAGSEGRLVDIDQAPSLEAHFQVDLNKASWPELAQLPGIGPTLAQRIVEYRAVYGPFQTHEELTKVRGIGQKTLERIRPYLLPLPSDCPRPDLASPPAQ